ncbi:YCF48-related protein [Algoriphagus boseongensis]|nr:YCF48-related protein [Algoriphagus boseongensis]
MQSWGLDFESIEWVDAQVGFAAGENLIAKTINGGQTWLELPFQFEGRILDLHFINPNLGWAVGENGLFLETKDGGESWKKIDLSFSGNLFKVEGLNPNFGIIVGEGGKIFTTTDSGQNWKAIQSGTSNDLFGLQILNENLLFLSGSDGIVLKSTNKGQSLEPIPTSTTADLFEISFTSPLIGYLAGENGVLLKTINGGASWSTLVSGVNVTLRDLSTTVANPQIVLAVGDEGTVIQSNNSGSSFVKVSLGTGFTKNVKGIGFLPSSLSVWICGTDGYLASSTNGGRNFTLRQNGYRNDFSGIDFKNETQGFVVGQKGQFLATGNGATSFVSRPIPESFDIITLDFWNASFGYVSGPNGKIYRTANSGSAWIERSIPNSPQVNGFYLFAPSVLYVAGNAGFVARSSSSADVWDTAITTNTTQNLKDLMFFDFQFGIAIGENGQLSYSSGGGLWTNLPKITNENLNGLAKLDGLQAIAVGNKGTIIKTSDMGLNWKTIPIPYDTDLLAVDFFDNLNGFISGKSGMFLATKDGGETWTKISSGTYRDLTSVSAGIPLVAYAAGKDGTIIKYTCVPPTGNLGAIAGKSETCLGTETYSITSDIVQGSELVWRVDGGEIISGQGTTSVEVKWTIPGRNGVYVSRLNFCGAGETSALEVKVSAIPSSNLIIDGQGAVCQSKTYTYQLPSKEGMKYTWTATGGEILEGQNTNKISIRWTSTGAQAVSVVLENLCGKSESIKLPIQIEQAPAQPSSITGASLSGLGEQNYEVVAVPNLDYRWTVTDGGKIITGQGTSKITVLWEKEGDFEVSVQAQNACDFGPKSSLAVKVNIITAIEPNSPEPKFKIFPNPSFGNLTIESQTLDTWRTIQIFNSLGQKITERIINPNEQSHYFENLPRGLNIIVLSGPKGESQRKLLIL